MFRTKQTHAKVIPDNLQELIINTEQLSTELKVRIQIRCDAGHVFLSVLLTGCCELTKFGQKLRRRCIAYFYSKRIVVGQPMTGGVTLTPECILFDLYLDGFFNALHCVEVRPTTVFIVSEERPLAQDLF